MNIVIIGGGASGIASAIKIKQNNIDANVTVLEHLSEPLKKIHATGNGRCNIANKNANGYEEVKNFLSSIGLVLREDEDGRMYPYSLQASSVVDVLLKACTKLGVKIETEIEVKSVEHLDNAFNMYTSNGIMQADVLILATGGKSQSALGSDGSGYALAKVFGHKITPLSPALVQLTSSSKHCRALKGVRTKCDLQIELDGEVVAKDYGELLFTDYGISGIVVMNLSRHINDQKLKSGQKAIAIIDLAPDISEDELKAHINKFGSLAGILPQKLCQIIEKQVGSDSDKMAKCVKNWRIIITGTKGYNFAQITNGGVANDELDESNQSKLCSNLYIIGELTDNQFECGGYNLTYAFYSGIKAANEITKYDKN